MESFYEIPKTMPVEGKVIFLLLVILVRKISIPLSIQDPKGTDSLSR